MFFESQTAVRNYANTKTLLESCVRRKTIILSCDKLCGIPSLCSHVRPACLCCTLFLIQIWIHMTACGMQAFWYDLAWAFPRAIKAVLLLTSSTPLNFGDPGALNFPMQAYRFVFLRSSVPRCPSAALRSTWYGRTGSSPLSFARRGFRVIMSTCGCWNLACLQHIFASP